jgi:hypothetical protein
VHAQQVDSAELSPGHFAHLLLNFVEMKGGRMIIIDSHNGYNKAMRSGNLLELQLHETLSYLGQLGGPYLGVLAQSGFLDEVRSPVNLTYLADTVIILRDFEAKARSASQFRSRKSEVAPMGNTIREFSVTEKDCGSVSRPGVTDCSVVTLMKHPSRYLDDPHKASPMPVFPPIEKVDGKLPRGGHVFTVDHTMADSVRPLIRLL